MHLSPTSKLGYLSLRPYMVPCKRGCTKEGGSEQAIVREKSSKNEMNSSKK